MENTWEQFKLVADEKVEARVSRLEFQLDCQQELINKLAERLQSIVRIAQGTQPPLEQSVKSGKGKGDNQVKKTESSDKDEE